MEAQERTITGTCNACQGRGKRGDGTRCSGCRGTGTITVMQSQLFQPPPQSQSKYGNEPVKANGLSFDSQAEYRYYLLLLQRQADGEISQLRVHPKFGLYAPGRKDVRVKVADYEADFTYVELETGRLVIVDVKGALTDVYQLKKKWMAAQGYEIEEVRV